MSAPIVFLSYSHDTDAHKEWVLKLATDLRAQGVDARLDQ
ncbi:MAG: toll/interleukin-1 receptor domain-containing protein [Nitrospirae bacterium]|nr:toll/interleukin-1 receptor domain-containing protein [Nitrospirota bacterium]